MLTNLFICFLIINDIVDCLILKLIILYLNFTKEKYYGAKNCQKIL